MKPTQNYTAIKCTCGARLIIDDGILSALDFPAEVYCDECKTRLVVSVEVVPRAVKERDGDYDAKVKAEMLLR